MIHATARGHALIEFKRPCYALRDTSEIVADRRDNSSYLRARFDTLRGCVIDTIYPVNEAQNIELRNLGDAPGRDTNR